MLGKSLHFHGILQSCKDPVHPLFMGTGPVDLIAGGTEVKGFVVLSGQGFKAVKDCTLFYQGKQVVTWTGFI